MPPSPPHIALTRKGCHKDSKDMTEESFWPFRGVARTAKRVGAPLACSDFSTKILFYIN